MTNKLKAKQLNISTSPCEWTNHQRRASEDILTKLSDSGNGQASTIIHVKDKLPPDPKYWYKTMNRQQHHDLS